ncbi:MAG: hypothetical protein KOO69_00620 [Victivallales bacterium]|nr:hypothetical protein [Victivallales bacterium]
MRVNIVTPEAGSYRLNRAILLYGNYNDTLATVHEVKDKAIQPGTPINQEILQDVLNDLGGKKKIKQLQALPENLIAIGDKAMVWFSPSRIAEIYFKTSDKKLDNVSGSLVRYPGIVFYVKENRMTAYAVYGNARPSLSAKLFQMPFYNCDDDGWVCLPGGRRPKPEAVKIPKWENLFYESNFSHAAAGIAAIVKGGHNKFWIRYGKQCRYKMPKRFPCERLLATSKTIEELIDNE